jgi:hypothetical protein
MGRAIGTRTEIVDGQDGPEIRIRAPRHWWPIVFLPFWLFFWTIGGGFAIVQFIRGSGPRAFLGLWLVGWLLGEVFAAFAWFWMVFGKEVVSVQRGVLGIARRIGRLGITKTYPLHECASLRAAGWFGPPFSFSASLRPWRLFGGTIAFESSGKTVRFGVALEEVEAQSVVSELERYVRPNT